MSGVQIPVYMTPDEYDSLLREAAVGRRVLACHESDTYPFTYVVGDDSWCATKDPRDLLQWLREGQ